MNCKGVHIQIVHLLIGLFVFISCTKENIEENSSNVASIPIEARTSIIPQYIVDNTGRYLYLFIRDVENFSGIVKKIDLSNLRVVNQVITPTSVPVSAQNVLFTKENDLIASFYDFTYKCQILYKFSPDLRIIDADTVAYHVLGGNYERMRIVNKGDGNILGIQGFTNLTGKPYVRCITMKSNFDILTERIDSSDEYGKQSFAGNGLIKTSDGGYLFDANQINPPHPSQYAIVEKRDANLNIVWRKSYATNGVTNAVMLTEHNGKYYVWCDGSDNQFNNQVFTLVYDLNGNLIQNVPIQNGSFISKTGEPMLVTDKGGFLMLAVTSLNTEPNLRKGVMYATDENLTITNTTYFGGNGSVLGSALLKVNANRYILIYLDNSFLPDGNHPRLILRYVDADGNFISK
jgi:hypothetical protein